MSTPRLKADKAGGADINVLNIADTISVLRYSLIADQPVGLEGPPGIGKSAVVAQVAKLMNMAFEPMILSLCDPTDIGGFPVVTEGQVTRLPLGPIRRACEEPVILFLDELTCAPPAVQGAAMRLIYERWAGEQKLHPGTRIVTAYNPADQAAGGWELALPLIGRMTKICMRPELKEIQEYLFTLGEKDSTLRALAVDLSATLQVAPDLIQIDPPAGGQTSGEPWGAPRSWERALRVAAAAIDDKVKDTSQVFGSLIAGNVGSQQAASFMTIRKVRTSLPSVEEVKTKPEKAMLPSDQNAHVAIIGIVAQVALQDSCAAWIYCDRLENETRVAALHTISKFDPNVHKSSPFFEKAKKAQVSLVKTITKLVKN